MKPTMQLLPRSSSLSLAEGVARLTRCASRYRRILSHFSDAIQNPDATAPAPVLAYKIPILGFSATFSRHDGLALGSVFEKLVYHEDFLQMIKDQWLCNVRFTSVHANIDLSEVTVNARTGEFNATSLSHVINTPIVNKLVVQTWLDKAGMDSLLCELWSSIEVYPTQPAGKRL